MSRAQLSIRIVSDDDWRKLESLAENNDFVFEDFEIDWRSVAPYWVGAYHDEDNLVGALNVCPGRPIGRMECLFLLNGLSHRDRTIAARELLAMAEAVLRRQGAQIVCGLIEDGTPGYERIAERKGWVQLAHGTMYAKGIVESYIRDREERLSA
jgi:hypothetical protein